MVCDFHRMTGTRIAADTPPVDELSDDQVIDRREPARRERPVAGLWKGGQLATHVVRGECLEQTCTRTLHARAHLDSGRAVTRSLRPHTPFVSCSRS
jgi:hypothetical protein